jgi:hypothetical protein
LLSPTHNYHHFLFFTLLHLSLYLFNLSVSLCPLVCV